MVSVNKKKYVIFAKVNIIYKIAKETAKKVVFNDEINAKIANHLDLHVVFHYCGFTEVIASRQ